MPRRTFGLLAISLLALILLSACSPMGGIGPTPTAQGALQPASIFRDLYDRLGGEQILGPAISPLFNYKDLTCQYTETVLICYNSTAAADVDRLFLVPLGQMMVTQTVDPTPKIYEKFTDMYNRLFGQRFVGAPLTGVRLNEEKHRYEQYFEKMGFYILQSDPYATVRLMAYGSYACREYCSYRPQSNTIVSRMDKGTDLPGLPSLERMGGTDVFGYPLSLPYRASDGSTEQLLENVLTTIPANNPNTIRLRPLGVILQESRTAPGPQQYGQKDGMVFYPVQGTLGYHVPLVFDEFIATHGGLEISGKPISDPLPVKLDNGQKIARQCFENLCLEYDPSQPDNLRIKLSPLGQKYLKLHPEIPQNFKFGPKSTTLKVNEVKPQISSKEQQTIEIGVFQTKDQQPIADIEAILVAALPDGKKLTMIAPPTGLNGRSSVTLPALTNAPNGSLIPYVVCLNVPADTQICQSETFLIWNVK